MPGSRFHSVFCLLFCLAAGQLLAQEPFVCRGNAYLAFTEGLGNTTVFEIVVDPETEKVDFAPLSGMDSGVDLNAVGYRYTDNFIYGVNSATLELYRVGRDGVAHAVTQLEPDRYMQYVAGDISPDGRYLVMVGTGFFSDEVLAFVDLDDEDFTYREIPLSGADVRCADIAFDPTDGKLYGFDGIEHRLVTYDVNSGLVEADFPTNEAQATLMGGLFFDTFGNLFGYGLGPGENAQQSLYRIDKANGQVTRETSGPPVARNDGCSCPYNVGMRETVAEVEAAPCTEVPIHIEIVNHSREVQAGLTLQQRFPESFEIIEIDNPFPGDLTEGGPGYDFFKIENLVLPEGRHTLTVYVSLGADASGSYNLQAALTGLPAKLGEVVVSDNPATLVQDDSTSMQVGGLHVDFSQVSTRICSGDTLVLNPSVPPGVAYRWNDGSTGPTLTVTESGTYSVTVSSGCETVEETITVGGIGFQLDLGQDREILLGESTLLQPRITPSWDGLSWTWGSSGSPVDCSACRETEVSPDNDTWYYLTATDTEGCSVKDSVWVQVTKDLNVYIPNAFSPNGDGNNDYFFFQSRRPQSVVSFRIFDRWGNLLFENADFQTNDPEEGWDGRFKGQALNNAVYYYAFAIQYPDGEVQHFKGEVNLVR